MPILARDIIRRCAETLQDTASVRWPVNELVRYLNDGQREIVLHRPDARALRTNFTCVPGTRQLLPPNGVKLIDVVSNIRSDGTRRAVRLISREILDAQLPNWRKMSGSDDVLHFMYDPREPRVFYVYPPATVNTQLEIIYGAYPIDVAEPADGAVYTAVTGNISLPDIYGNALQDYILYRAYLKDSEYAGNIQRAQAHYAAFANALNIEMKTTIAITPNFIGNLNNSLVQPQT